MCCLLHQSTSLDLLPGRTLSSLSILLIMRSQFHRFLAHALQLQSFSPGLPLPVFHVIHVCTHSLQPYREIFLPLTICAPPESTFKIQMSHPQMQHLIFLFSQDISVQNMSTYAHNNRISLPITGTMFSRC